MKCYTVDEQLCPGIRPIEDNGDFFLQAGVGTSQRIPVGKTFRDTIYQVVDLANRTMDLNGNPVIPGGLDSFPKIFEASFADDADRIVGRRESDDNSYALLSVCTQAGVGGKLMWTSAGYTLYLKRGRVHRRYLPFVDEISDPLPGVEIIAIGHGPQEEPHAIVRLTPGAEFRLVRTGALEGAPPWLRITWTGETLFVDYRGRNREQQEQRLLKVA